MFKFGLFYFLLILSSASKVLAYSNVSDQQFHKMFETEDNTTKRCVKGSKRIRRHKPSLNLNQGYDKEKQAQLKH